MKLIKTPKVTVDLATLNKIALINPTMTVAELIRAISQK